MDLQKKANILALIIILVAPGNEKNELSSDEIYYLLYKKSSFSLKKHEIFSALNDLDCNHLLNYHLLSYS